MQSSLYTPAPVPSFRDAGPVSLKLHAAAVIVLLLSGVVAALVVRPDASDETQRRSSELFAAVGAIPTSAPPAFVAPEAKFSAVFPTTPVRQEVPAERPGVKANAVVYEAVTNTEDVGVAYAELPVAPNGAMAQRALDAGTDGGAQRMHGNVVSRTLTTFLGRPAEDAVVASSLGTARFRSVIVDNRIYSLLVLTAKADAPHPAYDRLLATFQPL